MKTTTPIKLLLAASLVLVTACSKGKDQPQPGAAQAAAVPVTVAPVTSATVSETDRYVGTLISRRSVTLQPQISGQVSRIFVKAGARVRAGTPLLQVDPDRQNASLSATVAAIASSRADLKTAQETLKSLRADRDARVSTAKFQQQEFDRYTELVKEGAFSQQTLDQTRSSLDAAKANVAASDAQIAGQQAAIVRAQNAIKQAQANSKQQGVELGYYRIAAPFDGAVGDIPVKVGDYVTPATQLTSVTQNRPLEVNVAVPMERAGELRKGMSVELLDSAGKVVGDSRIFFIAPNINDQNQSVLIKALYTNANDRLRAAQIVQTRVVWSRSRGVLVPTTAISRVAGQNFVFVAQKQKDGKLIARQKPVQLGNIQGNDYEVTAGVKPGEQIVTAGLLRLVDGAPIAPDRPAK